MKVKCLNCGNEFELNEIRHDELGDYTVCPECGGSFDIKGNVWTFNDLLGLASEANTNKPIIIVVGGKQIPLKHALITTANEYEEFGTIGNLVIDLDV